MPIRTILILTLLLVGAVVGFIYSGLYNVGASEPHWGLTRWLMSTAMERSVQHHARGIEVPPLDDPALVESGFDHYRNMCVGCHGAPGAQTWEGGEGLNPEPPKLAETVPGWTPAELYWITKNGIKMTGMPAWSETHDDQALWAIVAFLEKLPELSEAQYRAMEESAKARQHITFEDEEPLQGEPGQAHSHSHHEHGDGE